MNNNKGMNVLDVILIVNFILKIVGVIDWSWWVVLWPLWVTIIEIIILAIIE